MSPWSGKGKRSKLFCSRQFAVDRESVASVRTFGIGTEPVSNYACYPNFVCMGAFNDILVPDPCPVCGAGMHSCQTYVAASFSGDENGRFCDGLYAIGERMRWWPESDARYPEWREGSFKARDTLPENTDLDAGYTQCPGCNTWLYVIIRFVDCTPVAIEGIGPEAEWPPAFG